MTDPDTGTGNKGKGARPAPLVLQSVNKTVDVAWHLVPSKAKIGTPVHDTWRPLGVTQISSLRWKPGTASSAGGGTKCPMIQTQSIWSGWLPLLRASDDAITSKTWTYP
jgi:hypothetical protein